MRKLRVVNYLTLDGVMQGPGHPDEDRSGGFDHGGWVIPYLDEVWGRIAGDGIAEGDALLFGRTTYEKMAAYWPNQPADDPIAATMNGFNKYVASRRMPEASWQPTTVLRGDVVTEVSALKKGPGKNITILGSGELLQPLIAHDLIDEYTLVVVPLVLGGGKRMFREGAPRRPFELVRCTPMTTGAVILTYRPR